MALKKCKECGKEISTEAKVCPHCGKKNPTGERVGCLALVLILLAVGAVMTIFTHDEPSSTTDAVQTAITPRFPPNSKGTVIPYREVEAWEVGMTIVIDPRFRSDSSLRALGSQLAARYAARPFFNVLIYDSDRAARLRLLVDNTVTDKDQLAFYDRHFLGAYTKNSTTGFHAFEYSLKGMPNAVPKRIDY